MLPADSRAGASTGWIRQMDALTAGTALIAVQLCVALVMAGIFYAAPTEKYTRYWALSGVLVAAGVLIVILNAGAPRYAALVLGNNLLMLGMVFQWSGIRAFYRKPDGYAGWAIGAAFFLLYGLLLFRHAGIGARAILSSGAILAMLALNFTEILSGHGPRRSFARVLSLCALALLVSEYAMRLYFTITRTNEFLPNSNAVLPVTLLYLLPIVGTLLFSNGLLLLYFERIVADKDHLATHDELSGVLNRRAIVTGGERELRLATRLRLPLAIAFVDIDRFKNINDTLGHDAGDTVITELAQMLEQTCRNIDLVGRYGGEEFCIVFPGVDETNAAIIGDRLVNTVREHTFGIGLPVTISVGMAVLPGDDDHRAWAGLMHRADAELYKAKESGRNRFSLSA
jgi:diguanylate cyclase (GGDEF)-like protein